MTDASLRASRADRPLRIVHAGMGAWGRDWMPITAGAPDVDAVCWIDPSPEARAATVALGAPPDRVLPDLRPALRDARAEAALVTTPIEHHVPVMIDALDAGCDLLVEKPFAPTMADAAMVLRAAAAAGRIVMVSQNYRHHPAPRLVSSLVASGRIGEVTAVEVDFRRHPLRRAAIAARHYGMDHPLLIDMAVHHFDLLRLVLGREPIWVEVQPINPPGSPYRDPPAAFATLAFAGGTAVSYRGSWISSGRRTPWGGEWRMEGTAGSIEWRSRGDPGVPDLVRVGLRGTAPRPVPLPVIPALDRAGTLAAFVASVRGRAEPETSGRRNLATLALTLAAVRSATERRRVEVRELLDDVPEDLR